MLSLVGRKKLFKKPGFTIVELLVVIAVIGILAAVTMVSYTNITVKARDTQRVSDMEQIVKLLNLYLLQYSDFPTPSYNGPGGWESSSINPGQFLQSLKTTGFITTVPVDPVNNSTSMEYRYYRYNAGDSGCDASRGDFFVLGVMDMESSSGPYPKSPGWSCPNRNWQNEFDWVTGGFQK